MLVLASGDLAIVDAADPRVVRLAPDSAEMGCNLTGRSALAGRLDVSRRINLLEPSFYLILLADRARDAYSVRDRRAHQKDKLKTRRVLR